jgi:hypothetical protein
LTFDNEFVSDGACWCLLWADEPSMKRVLLPLQLIGIQPGECGNPPGVERDAEPARAPGGSRRPSARLRPLHFGSGPLMPPHQGRFVAYFRVSTDRQGKSGLGLEAQREAIQNYLNGGRWSLVAEFTEIESGKRNDRPELEKAMTAGAAIRASVARRRML